jgi:GT2 family glycosyltransferase
MSKYKLGIIIPFYNGDDVIEPCLNSIAANNYPAMTVYLVNNSDKPTNIRAIAELYENVHVINTDPRIGFSRANNLGADQAISDGAEIIISINQDLILDKNCLKELIEPLISDPQIGIAAPISFTYDFMSINELFARYCIADNPDMIFDALNCSLKQYYAVQEVHGACFAVSAKTIKEIGFFDPLYFMYCEDTDLCRKMRYAKKINIIVSKARVGHINSLLSTEIEGQRVRYRWRRMSNAIYVLKELNNPMYFNILKVTRNILTDYFKTLFKLDIRELAVYFISDIKLLFIMKRIIASRQNEKRLLVPTVL